MRLVQSWETTTLALDWLEAIERYERSGEGLTEDARERYSAADLGGVKLADVLWVLADTTPSEGAATELGWALALSKHVIVSGPASAVDRNLFNVEAVRFTGPDADVKAWRWLTEQARRAA